MKRPTGVTVIAVLAIIGAVILMLGALPFLGFGSLFSFLGSSATVVISGASATIVATLGITLGLAALALAVATLVFGIYALQLKSWAWTLGIVLMVISLVLTVGEMFVVGVTVSGVVSGLIALAILVYLYTSDVRTAFGHEPHAGSSTHTPMPSH